MDTVPNEVLLNILARLPKEAQEAMRLVSRRYDAFVLGNAAKLPSAPSAHLTASSAAEPGNSQNLERYAEARQSAIQLLAAESHLLQRGRDGMDRVASGLRPFMQLSGFKVKHRYVRWHDDGVDGGNIYDHEDSRQWFVTMVGRKALCGLFLHNVSTRYSLTLRQPVLEEGEEPLTIHHLNMHRSIETNIRIEEVAAAAVGPDEQPLERLMRKNRRLFSSRPLSEVKYWLAGRL